MTSFLNLPPLQKGTNNDGENSKEYCFPMVSKHQFLAPSGNTLRISSMYNTEAIGDSEGWNEQTNDIIATAERGFTCLAFNPYHGWIAYSPRSPMPIIVVQALHNRRKLCSLEEGGAKLSYQSICFSRKGSKIAAIGRGNLDARIVVWELKSEVLNGEASVNMEQIVSFPIKQSVHCCLFDPNDDNKIAILASDKRTVLEGRLTKFVGGKYKIEISKYPMPSRNISISAMSWESNGTLLLGFQDGSLLALTGSHICPSAITVQKCDSNKYGAVRAMVITCEYLIVAYECGTFIWYRRHLALKEFILGDQDHREDLGSDPLYVTTSPAYDNIIAYTNDGSMHQFPICFHADRTEKDYKCSSVVTGDRICFQYPSSVVTGMTCINLTGKLAFSIFVSGSSDGRIKAWPDSKHQGSGNASSQMEMLGCIDIGVPITSMTCLSGYPVFIVGCEDSSLKFVAVSRKKAPSVPGNIEVDLTIIKSEILCLSPVTHLAFNKETKKLAAACSSGQVFVLCTEASNLHVIGVLEIENESNIGNLASIFWSKDHPTHLFVGTFSKRLFSFDTVPLCFSPKPLKPFWEFRLPAIARGLVKGVGLDTGGGQILACTVQGRIELYELQSSVKSYEVKLKIQEFSHSSEASLVIFSENQMLLGTNTGDVHIVEELKEGTYDIKMAPKVLSSPLISIAISSDGARMYSSSEWAAVVQPCLGPIREVTRSSYDYDYLLPTKREKEMTVQENTAEKRQTWLCKANNEALQTIKVKSSEAKREVVCRLEEVTMQVQYLVEATAKNENDPIFIVDLDAFKRKQGETNSKLKSFQDNLNQENVENKRKIKSLVEQYIGCMEDYIKVYEIGQEPEQFVSTFPLSLLQKEEKRRLQCITILRLNEIADAKASSAEGDTINGIPFECKYIVGWRNDSTQQDLGGADEYTNSYNSTASLLYPPQTLATTFQRNMQIILMQHTSRDHAVQFNSTVALLRKEKQELQINWRSIMDAIRSIMVELQIEESNYINEQRFDVDISPECFGQFEMEGTCTTHQNPIIQVTKSTSGSYLDVNSGSDKLVLSEDDEEEHRQQRMDELKRLIFTADNIISTFNSKLASSRISRFGVQQKQISADIYLRLLGNFKADNIDNELHQLNIEHSRVHELWKASHRYLHIAQTDYEKVSQDLQCAVAHDRDMEKSFRAKIQNQSTESLDVDCVDLLYQMFQRRDFASRTSQQERSLKRRKGRKINANSTLSSALIRRSKMGRQSGRDSGMVSNKCKSHEESSSVLGKGSSSVFGTMKQAMMEVEFSQGEQAFQSIHDPFMGVDDGQTLTSGHHSVADIASPTIDDIPEGFHVEGKIFESMIKLREEKISQEGRLDELRKVLYEAKSKLEAQESEETTLSQKLGTLSSMECLLHKEKSERARCPYFVISAKRSIDEIEMDTADALFIPTEPVDAVNRQIKEVALQDLDLLQNIKSLRRNIKKMQWDQEVLDLNNKNAKELLSDFHLIRLSSSLKDMLNGNVEDTSKTRKRVKDQLCRQEITHQTKIDRLKKEQQQLRKAILKRSKENNLLEQQMKSLTETVHTEEQDQKINETFSEPCEDKMKMIRRRSKRKERMKQQSGDISKLRDELDRIKQKNFPSFAAFN